MNATIRQTKQAQPVGTYTHTSIDVRKANADFLIIQTSPYFIKWNSGVTENVSEKQLNELKANHTWETDF